MDVSSRRDEARRKGRHPFAKEIQAGHIGFAEGPVLPVFPQNDMQDPGQKFGIGTGPRLQEKVREVSGFGASRIDDDQLQAARLCILERFDRILAGKPRQSGAT